VLLTTYVKCIIEIINDKTLAWLIPHTKPYALEIIAFQSHYCLVSAMKSAYTVINFYKAEYDLVKSL